MSILDQLFVPIECQYASEYNHGSKGYHGWSFGIEDFRSVSFSKNPCHPRYPWVLDLTIQRLNAVKARGAHGAYTRFDSGEAIRVHSWLKEPA